MTEAEQFDAILRELAELLLDLGDLSHRAVLIGGQVLALESLQRRGSAVIEVQTETQLCVSRGFSFEPDLLFDLEEDDFMAERLPEVLRARGYRRVRDFRWSKQIGPERDVAVKIDLFAPVEVDPVTLPTPMSAVPDARLVLRHKHPVEHGLGSLTLRISIPDPVAFLALKLRAKLTQRPHETKDSFDLYVYVRLIGLDAVRESIEQAGEHGRRVARELLTLFRNQEAPGVRDVLNFATSYGAEEQALLAGPLVDRLAFNPCRRTNPCTT